MKTSHETKTTDPQQSEIDSAIRYEREQSQRRHAITPRALERQRVQRNRRRVAGIGAITLVAATFGAKQVVDSFESHMGAEQAVESCVVINEPLKNRTLTKVAEQKAGQLHVDPSDTTAITKLAHEMQDFGGPEGQPFGSALFAGPEKMINIELCTSTEENVPVKVYSKDR